MSLAEQLNKKQAHVKALEEEAKRQEEEAKRLQEEAAKRAQDLRDALNEAKGEEGNLRKSYEEERFVGEQQKWPRKIFGVNAFDKFDAAGSEIIEAEMIANLRLYIAQQVGAGPKIDLPKDSKRWQAPAVAEVFEDKEIFDTSGKVIVDKFCTSYIKAYNSILEHTREISSELQSTREALSAASESENLNAAGVMQDAALTVTHLRARNLTKKWANTSSKLSLTLSVEPETDEAGNYVGTGKPVCTEPCIKKSSEVAYGTSPVWEDSFSFAPMLAKSGVLVVKLYDSGALVGKASIQIQKLLDQLKQGFCVVLVSNNGKNKEQSIDFEAQFKYSNVETLTLTTKELEGQQNQTQEALMQLKAPFVCLNPVMKPVAAAPVEEVDSSGCGILGCT